MKLPSLFARGCASPLAKLALAATVAATPLAFGSKAIAQDTIRFGAPLPLTGALARAPPLRTRPARRPRARARPPAPPTRAGAGRPSRRRGGGPHRGGEGERRGGGERRGWESGGAPRGPPPLTSERATPCAKK